MLAEQGDGPHDFASGVAAERALSDLRAKGPEGRCLWAHLGEQAMVGRTKADGGERRKLEAELDKALAQTFPASDPYSIGHFTSTEPPSRPVDRQAPELLLESVELPPGRRRRRPSR
jgi:hypothetical protein